MKTRLSTMAVAVSSASLFTACGGGSGTSDFPVAIPLPRVVITAPATVTVGVGFAVLWSSSGATSCNAGTFSSATDTNGSFSRTETTVGTKTYSVTCTGDGGSTTGTATTIVGSSPVEGAWLGTTDDNRTIDGVILAVDITSSKSPFWLAYATNNTPSGFIAGAGSATTTTFSSGDLREFNFGAGRVNATGTLSAPYIQKTSIGASSTGSFTDYDSATNPVYPINYTVTSIITPHNVELSDPAHPVLFSTNVPIVGTGTLSNIGVLTLNVSGSLQMDASVAFGSASYKADVTTLGQIFKFNTATNGSGTHLVPSSTQIAPLSPTDTYVSTTACTDSPTAPFAVCSLKPPFYPLNSYFPLNVRDLSIPGGPNIPNYYENQIIDPTAAVNAVKAVATIDSALDYELAFTLTKTGGAPTTTAFSLAYSANYESIPNLALVASNSYTAAYTGIDATMYHTSTPFSISSGGTINGTETTSHCDYSGNIAPHATGNVYDVTALTFTSSNGTCVYASSGTFTGIATLDAATGKTLTVTALNATRSQGFMVVATKP